MSADRTCNGSFWTKEEDKIFENALAIYSSDDNLLMKIAAALPGKSLEEIIHHYELLVEDVNAIEAGNVPLPKYRRMPSHSHQKSRLSKADVERRRGVAWTEEEHRSFLRGLEKYGRGDWRSISRQCVLSRTPTQVASHAQKFFSRLKAVDKEKRRTSIHDITSVDTETTGTSQLPNHNNMIGPAGGGSQIAVTNNVSGAVDSIVVSADVGSFNENMLSRAGTVAGGESSGPGAAFVNERNSLYPDVNDEFILGLDNMIMEQEGTFEAGFLVDNSGGSQLPSAQPSTAAGKEIYNHPVTSIGYELEALITEHMVEDNEINSIFDVGKSAPSHTTLSSAARTGMYSRTVASIGAKNACGNMGAAPKGGLTIHPEQLPFIAPSSGLGVGLFPNSNTSFNDEDIFDLEDLFKDPMI